jgi:hypothetical protein
MVRSGRRVSEVTGALGVIRQSLRTCVSLGEDHDGNLPGVRAPISRRP